MATNEELHTFVRDALAKGVGRSEVEGVLTQSGWGPVQVHGALAEFADVAFPVPVPMPRASLDARDAFLHFVLFGTLYICAFNLGSLIFHFVNLAFPDPAFSDRFGYATSAVRWSIASLIITLPVFLFVSNRTSAAIRNDPAKRGAGARRWLTYLTLSLASAILIGDFITLVYNVLSGELSVRFALKVVTVATIAGSIFGYYLWDLRGDEKGVAS